MEFFSGGGGDPLSPSIFELIAQEQLKDLLSPAIKYVLAVFAQRYPRYLLRIVNSHEEFYAGIMLLVERHYLRKHNASFAENFYGLKRRRTPLIPTLRAQAAVGGIPEGERLRSRDISRSLLFLVCVPYLRAKAQDYFESFGGGIPPDLLEDGASNMTQALTDPSMKGHLRRAFMTLYPWLNTAFEVWLMTWNVAYLFDRTPHYRPWLAWIGIDLRRLGADDFRLAHLSAQTQASSPRPQSLLSTFRRLLFRSPQLVLDSLRLLLPTAIFFYKFLEWFYSPTSPARAFAAPPTGPSVPPPAMLSPHPNGLPFDPTQYGVCPICREKFKNPTALPSGYVFCYRCAYERVNAEGTCPVTLTPVRVWQLRKVLG